MSNALNDLIERAQEKVLHETGEIYNGKHFRIRFSRSGEAFMIRQDGVDHKHPSIIAFNQEFLPELIMVKSGTQTFGFSYGKNKHECNTWGENSMAAGLVHQDEISRLGDFQCADFPSVAAMYSFLEASAAKSIRHPELKEKVAAAKEKVSFVKVHGFAAAL